jgi:hypothetical protein
VQPANYTHKKVVVAGFGFVEGKRQGRDRVVVEEGLIVGGAA